MPTAWREFETANKDEPLICSGRAPAFKDILTTESQRTQRRQLNAFCGFFFL